ncbi:hypothetical protein G7Y79_00013g034120 [Physcia stellaris]|nr:hypothetical protein G7Y79_00013g034120 [Physcia stellaris]
MARLNPEIHDSPEKAPTTRNYPTRQTEKVSEAKPPSSAPGTEDSKTPILNTPRNTKAVNSPLTPSIPRHLRPQPFSTAALAQPPTPTTARTRDNPAVPQKSSPLKPQVAATPSSFDNFMLKMKKKADEQRIPPQADSPSVQEDVFFTPEAPAQARPAGAKVSLDEVTSTIDEALDSMKVWGEEIKGSQSPLNMSLLNSGLPSSFDAGLKAVKSGTSMTSNKGFGGARPLPALPNRLKNVERPIEPPIPFEARPETQNIRPIFVQKPTTPKEEPKTPPNSAAEVEDLEEHIAKLHRCLEIHSLLLTRVNALPIEDNSPIIPQLHGHLSSCERRLHYLLRNAPGSAFRSSAASSLSAQQELAERCVDTLEMVTREMFAIEARNAGEMGPAGVTVTKDLEADGGVDVELHGSGSQGRSEVEDSGKLSPGEVSGEMSKKKRRGHRGPRKSKSKKKDAAAVSDEQHSEAEEEDVWQGGVPLKPGEVVSILRRNKSAERDEI